MIHEENFYLATSASLILKVFHQEANYPGGLLSGGLLFWRPYIRRPFILEALYQEAFYQEALYQEALYQEAFLPGGLFLVHP